MTYYTISRDPGGFVAAWPTKGQVYFARLDGDGQPTSSAEIRTPGQSGMRTGVLVLSGGDGCMLVAWKKNDQLGWQLYDAEGSPSGVPGTAESPGDGAAGVVGKDGGFILFR
jgi:hypothetical protein